jgi:hypothetical protein
MSLSIPSPRANFRYTLIGSPIGSEWPPCAKAQTRTSVRDFLEQLTYRREEVATLLGRGKPDITKFDPEVGWLFTDYVIKKVWMEARRS